LDVLIKTKKKKVWQPNRLLARKFHFSPE